MRVHNIRFEKLVNLGNFEHEKYVAEAVVSENEDKVVAFDDLRHFVIEQAAKGRSERSHENLVNFVNEQNAIRHGQSASKEE